MALVPEVVGKLVPAGFEVLVSAAPAKRRRSRTPPTRRRGARARGRPTVDAEAVVKVQKPSEEEAGRLREGQVLIGFLQPLTDPGGNRAARRSAA